MRAFRIYFYGFISCLFLWMQGLSGVCAKDMPQKTLMKKAQKKKNTTKNSSKKSKKKDNSTSKINNKKDDQVNFEQIQKDIAAIHSMNALTTKVHTSSHQTAPNKQEDAAPPPIKPNIDITDRALIFHFDKRPGIALVRIYDDFWLFFDGVYPFSKVDKYPMGVTLVEECSTDTHSIFKIRMNAGYFPIVQSDVHNWSVEFVNTPRTSKSKKIINWPNKRDDPVKILLPSYVSEVTFFHPKTQLQYTILTSRKESRSLTPQESFPQFDVMESHAGLGLLPKTDTLVLKRDSEGENILLYDNFGMIPKPYASENGTFFKEKYSTASLTGHLQELRGKNPQAPENMLEQIRILTRLSMFSEMGMCVQKMEDVCAHKINEEEHVLDFVKLVHSVLEPRGETATKNKHFTLRNGLGAEFTFWYNLYHKRPQNYAFALEHFLPHYPTYFKNRIVEILLSLPDENDNLEKLITLKDIDNKLIEEGKLKLALIPPVNIRTLEEIVTQSKSRDIQAQAMFELVKQKKEHGDWKAGEIIKKMTPFLFSYGPKEFEAKLLLASAHMEVEEYARSIRLFKEIRLEFKERQNEVDTKIREAYKQFFKKVMDKDPKNHPAPLDVIAFYNEFDQANPEGEEGRAIFKVVIENMRKLSLIKPALEILSKAMEAEKDTKYKKNLALDLVMLHIDNHNPEMAEKILESVDFEGDQGAKDGITKLKIDICLLKNDFPTALRILEGKEDLFSQKERARVLWKMKDIKALYPVLTHIIEKDESDKSARALYVVQLAAINLLQSPHPMTFEDMRIRYGNLVKGTEHEKIFNILTTPDQMVREGLMHFGDLDLLLNYVKGLSAKKRS